MRRQSLTSSSRTLLSQLILPAALAISISSAPVTLMAQKKDENKKSKTVQVEITPRQKAEDYLKQARKELKKDNFAIARDYLEKAKSSDVKAPGISTMAKDISVAENTFKLEQKQGEVKKIVDGAKKSLKDGKFDQATAQAQKALDLDPTNKKAKALLTDIEAEKLEAAESALEEGVNKRIKAAEMALKDKKFEQARRSHAVAVEAAKGMFKEDLADLLKEINEAESKDTARQNQDQIDQLMTTAETQLEANQFAPARQTVNQVLQLDKNNKDAKSLLADIADDEKDFEANRAVRESEKELQAAKRLLKADKFEAAVAAYEAILAKNSKNEEAQEGLDKAKDELAEAKEKEVENRLEAIIERGETALDKDDLAGAEKALADAKTLAPQDKDVVKLQDKIKDRTDEIKAGASEKELNAVVAKGNAALAKKDVESAKTALVAAKALAPNDKSVRNLQEDIDDLVADLQKAESDKQQAARQKQVAGLVAAGTTALTKGDIASARSSLNEAKKLDANARSVRKLEDQIEDKEAGLKKAEAKAKKAEAKKLAKAKEVEAKKLADAKKKAEQKKVAKQATPAKTAAKETTTSTQVAKTETVKPVAVPVTRSVTEDKAEEEKPVEVAQVTKKVEEEKVAPKTTSSTEVAKTETVKPVAVPVTRSASDDKAAANKKAKEAEAKLKADKAAADKKAKADKAFADKKAEAVEAKLKADKAAADKKAKEAEFKQKAEKEAARREAKAAEARKAEETKRQAEAEKKAAEEKQLKAEQQKEAEEKAATQKRQREQEAKDRAEELVNEGIDQYDSGKLEAARQSWTRSLTLAPEMEKAKAYLENTEQEYNDLLAQRQTRVNFQQSEKDAQEKMNTLIPFRTMAPNSLSDFLSTLRLLSGIDFVIVGEVNAKVEVAFEDEPLHKVLDSVLLPMGLKWRRAPGSDTIIIEPDLRTEVFAVTPNQLTTIDALIEEGVFGRLLYGPTGEAVIQGQEVFTDSRQNLLIITDSAQNIDKIRRTLDSLKNEGVVPGLVIDTFEIEEQKAPEIKALLSAILSVDDDMPYNPERKLILEGSTLIIKDTSENIQRVREILQDEGFMSRFVRDELSVSTFNLTPVLEFEDNPDLVQSFTDNVRQVVETLLYAKEGRSKAVREGRRLWYDPATKQLTITDTPDRLQTIQDFIESLPQIRSRRQSKIIFIDHAQASQLVGQIESFLGVESDGSGANSGDEITKTMRVEDELEFNDAFFRVTRVNENDASDDNDDSVEMVVRTGDTTQDVTIEEFRSEFVEEFEIIVDDVKPSGTEGEGRARMTIIYNADDEEDDPEEDDEEDDLEDLEEETGLTIVDIDNLNAIFVQYENVEDLREVEFWIRTLDIPTLQVSIEIKFVEVVTNKSKQWLPDFAISDLTDGISVSDSVLSSRFAQDQDEFSSVFDPLAETPDAANLLKGATVFDWVLSNGNSPISFSLKMLEAQGVINVVNGPTVTVLNTETADFTVERRFGLPTPTEGSTGNDADNFNAVASIEPVDLSVTPNVTRAGNITLDIDVTIDDFDVYLGSVVNLDAANLSPVAPASTAPEAIATNNGNFGILHKELTTLARISDGGTVVLGGWRSERTTDLESGIPLLQDIPFIGPLLFTRTQKDEDKITLLIFLTGQVVRD
jgi:colicin import membrane protein